jgi:magnesium transporter
MEKLDHLHEPVLAYARKDFALLKENMTIRAALEEIRQHGVGERIIYFYVTDERGRLVGVVPTRRLLTAPHNKHLSEIMITAVITIPSTATVFEACEYFAVYKFLAFPVVDQQLHMIGVVDVNLFTEEVTDFAEREQSEAVFESIGFRINQVRDAAPTKAFRYRFPWLLATIGSGSICAILAGAFEATLAQSLVIAFFMALVLGLGESVSMQSMTVTVQALRVTKPTLRWYLTTLRREAGTALLLGAASGIVVGVIVTLWRGVGLPALVIGASILLSLFMACVLGLTIPWLLHVLKLDPKIAAGPVTLALADLATLLFYLTMASWVL